LEHKVKKYQTRTLKKKEVEEIGEKETAERSEKNEKCDCPKILLVDDNEWNVYVLNI